MIDLLFVYGTLRGRFGNRYAEMLRAEARFLATATVSGSIFLISDYPGYRPDPPGSVQGELYRLSDPDRLIPILDEYEGPDFERVLIDVAGQAAWIYQFRSRPPIAARIASGDFCAL
ncbi:MAG TPA: gamma-glutamylcyclotransferase family protein [Bryobacteraceae bacterium]|nr:gamma-glutamylcyclotransferase family protein [Bryobacteraceae bacterium]